MRRHAFAIALTLAGSSAGALCVDWKASGPYADVEAADLIFEGTVARIETDPQDPCGPDRVVVKTRTVWKGRKEAEYTLFQPTRRIHQGFVNGKLTISGCPTMAEATILEADRAYVVFAVGAANQLRSMSCGLSQTPTAALRKRLDTWVRKSRVK